MTLQRMKKKMRKVVLDSDPVLYFFCLGSIFLLSDPATVKVSEKIKKVVKKRERNKAARKCRYESLAYLHQLH